jgi:hypothetical protein
VRHAILGIGTLALATSSRQCTLGYRIDEPAASAERPPSIIVSHYFVTDIPLGVVYAGRAQSDHSSDSVSFGL